jgi:hypothetical protein
MRSLSLSALAAAALVRDDGAAALMVLVSISSFVAIADSLALVWSVQGMRSHPLWLGDLQSVKTAKVLVDVGLAFFTLLGFLDHVLGHDLVLCIEDVDLVQCVSAIHRPIFWISCLVRKSIAQARPVL